ncbi:MAG: hypothetical protein QW786_02795 [Candidatus Hadarchaeum sp.]
MAENFTDTDSDVINLNYMVGEQGSSVTLRPMKDDAEANLAAAKAVANLLEENIDADLMSVTARQAVTDNEIRDDSAAKIYPTRFNFQLIEEDDQVTRVTIFVPWAKQGTQAEKKVLGQAIATALSGTKGTYVFRS